MITLEDSLAPIMWTNIIMGQATIKMKTPFANTKLKILYGLGIITCYSLTIWHRHTKLSYIPGLITLTEILFKVILTASIITSLTSTIFGYIYIMNIEIYKKKIKLADKTLEIFGMNPQYDKSYKENIVIILRWAISGILKFVSLMSIYINISDNMFESFIRTMVFTFPQLLISLLEANFIAIISSLGRRFERVNALVYGAVIKTSKISYSININKYEEILNLEHVNNTKELKLYQKNRNNIEYVLITTRQLHLDLCKTARLINHSYGKQLALQMASNFLILTGYSYGFIIFFNDVKISRLEKFNFCISLLVRIIVTTLWILNVMKACVNVVTEAKKTSRIAHEIHTSEKKIIDEIHEFSLQLMQNPLTLTAAGLFNLDFSSVQTLYGAITTYLVILIQTRSRITETVEEAVDD